MLANTARLRDDAHFSSVTTCLWADTTYMATIEAQMKQICVGASDHELGRMAWEHIATGGKRLRARLALFAAQALGGRAAEGVAWGVSCELLHQASLIHDDIQDGDEYRRNQLALWVRYGVAQAINAGDLCIALSYSAIEAVPGSDGLRWQLTRLVARSSRLIVEGQAREMGLLSRGVPTWEDYATCVEGKTSALFSLPVEGAALITGRSPDQAAALAAICRPIGLLFQIQDDILDLFGESGRDVRGSDLAQPGKATALVVEHLRLHREDTDWLLGVVKAAREETPQEAIDLAIARFESGGALEAVWERIDEIRSTILMSPVLASEQPLAELVKRFVAEALRPVEHTRPGNR